jgi:hypothetical protein
LAQALHLTQWFADTTNGITDFFAKICHFDEVCAKEFRRHRDVRRW